MPVKRFLVVCLLALTACDSEYDETYHFPKRISIDFIQNAADDEIAYSVQSFAVSPATSGSR